MTALPGSLWQCGGTTLSAVGLPAFHPDFRDYNQNKVSCNILDLSEGKDQTQLCQPEWDDFLKESLCCCLVIKVN